MAPSTTSAPSLPRDSLYRQSSAIRTGCANERPSGSVRGVSRTVISLPGSISFRGSGRQPTAQFSNTKSGESEGLHLGVVGDTYTILLSGTDTAGQLCLIDMYVPPGG